MMDIIQSTMAIRSITIKIKMITNESARLISTNIANTLRYILNRLGITSVRNISPTDEEKSLPHTQNTRNTQNKEKTCPMKLGKPFATNYMDQMIDDLEDDDWDIEIF